jgi:hypothetical protein
MRTYSAVFAELFLQIFGTGFVKPHIRREAGRWVCKTLDGKTGYGVTPAMAFGAYAALVGK